MGDTFDLGKDIKIIGLMSCPRFGPLEAYNSIIEALRPYGIGLRLMFGAYWHMGIQAGLKRSLDDGIDWTFMFDFDSMVTVQHISRMMVHLGQNPEIDAIASLQPQRKSGNPLYKPYDDQYGNVEVEVAVPVRAHTAHMGCTLIRNEGLAKMPLPWLCGQPASDGTWDGVDAVHPDIDFWNRWKQAGNTLYIAHDVRIGHLELQVQQYDEHLQHETISVSDWYKKEDLRK